MIREKIDCLIIGSGPSGYTAAIYASRANIKPVLYRGIQPGGQLTLTTDVENYPGYPDGITGDQMMIDFEAQARRMGADVRDGMITKVDFSNRPFIIEIDERTEIEANCVIISTGASAKWLGIESETKLNGYGVSACATCDGFFFKDRDVVVVGGGDTACEEALYLSRICSQVHLLVRGDKMRASNIMQSRVLKNQKISVHFNTEVDEILGTEFVTSVRTKTQNIINCEAVFIAIGHRPNSDIFKGQIDMDELGYITTVAGTSHTNVQGVFACGDVQDKIYRQAVTAAGTGCMAALDAERFLSENE